MSEAKHKQQTAGLLRWAAFFRSRLRRPFSFYLISLLVIAIVPSFIFSMIVLKRSTDEQQRTVAALLTASTGSVTRIVDREVQGMLTTLKVLSDARILQEGGIRALYERASSALAESGSYLIVIDRSHNQLLNTRVAFGAPLSKASDPNSVDAAFRGNAPLLSNVFFGNTARKWVFNVYLPVKSPSGNGDYLLAMAQDAQSMAKAVNKDMLSPFWNAALLDSTGNVIVSSDKTVATGKPFFMDIVPALRVGIGEAVYDRVKYRTVTEFSTTTGWKTVAWAKSADVDAPALWSYLWLSLGAILFAGIAIAGSIAIAGLLSQGVKLLAKDAHLLGEGRKILLRKHMISEVETVSAALFAASQARTKSENEIRFLMREVAHRSKNQLTVIQSMLNQSLNASENRVDFAESFRKRIAGLARSTDLMIANAAQGVDFNELAHNQLQPFVPDDPARVRLSGPPVRLDTQASQTLGMALHELATNATKYGALAGNEGVVSLNWSLQDGVFSMVWKETGAQLSEEARAADRKGFGTMVLERMLGMALSAKLDRQMHADGIEWRVDIPHERLNTSLANAPQETAP